jgi:hypothetical protein
MTRISVNYPIIGAKVVRGRDWKYGEQDGGEGNIGTIVEKSGRNGWVEVKWKACNTNLYRMGAESKYDLYFATEKDALLQEAMERFPSGCSYLDKEGQEFTNIVYDYPYWWSESGIALKEDEGLVYNKGVWAERTDVPVKEERVEVFPGIYIGDTVVSLRDVGSARKIGDIFRVLPYSKKNDLFYTKSKSSCDKESWRLATPAEIKFYNNGGKNINDILKKELSPLELCKQMYSVGDVVETTIDGETHVEKITQEILDELSVYGHDDSISCMYLKGFLYRGKTKQYAKIISNDFYSQTKTNQNGEHKQDTEVRSFKVQRSNLSIPTGIRTGGSGLKSADRKVGFRSNGSNYQERFGSC